MANTIMYPGELIEGLYFQASELTDKRSNVSPNTPAVQVPKKSEGTMGIPVTSATAQRLPPGMIQHAIEHGTGKTLDVYLRVNFFSYYFVSSTV